MAAIRPPAVAGTFYPDDADRLDRAVQSLLDRAEPTDCNPLAIIAPHAGIMYSGPIAASAYASLSKRKKNIKRIVLLGPSHRVAFQGLALSGADAFATPLGLITLDQEIMDRIRPLPQVRVIEEAHAREHSLEVHLPFLQKVFGDFVLTPLAVGRVAAEEVARVIGLVIGEPNALIVVSSDLSHYKDYHTAQALDRLTSRAIEDLAPERISYENACGRNAVNGLLVLAREMKLSVRTLDLRNSGDTAGDKSRVVGYGAYVFE